jgi:cytochrome c oxidase subunit 3
LPDHHDALVAHQFEDVEQQREATALGMWAFLITEVMFFGGLFTSYTVYRMIYPDAFAAASHHLDYRLGALNTAVLICSSMTMALAVQSAQRGKQRNLILFLLLTMLLGLTFLGVKVFEYRDKFHHHLIPGGGFEFEGPYGKQAQIFFSLYFAMTGLHAVHMIIGLGILGTLVGLSRRGWFSSEYYTPVELSGLYWHFVDIVWIYLFPLLYLMGRT